MTRWILAAAALLALVAGAPARAAAPPAAHTATADEAKLEAALAREARETRRKGALARGLAWTCSQCHGLEGSGASPVYPRLAGQPAAYLAAQLDAFAAGRRRAPQMQPLALALSAQERSAISAYYASYRAPAPAAGTASIDSRAAALTAPCKHCHGAAFEGAEKPLLAPRLAGQGRDYLVAQLAAFRSGARSDPTGAMAPITKTLSEADIAALADALSRR